MLVITQKRKCQRKCQLVRVKILRLAGLRMSEDFEDNFSEKITLFVIHGSGFRIWGIGPWNHLKLLRDIMRQQQQ